MRDAVAEDGRHGDVRGGEVQLREQPAVRRGVGQDEEELARPRRDERREPAAARRLRLRVAQPPVRLVAEEADLRRDDVSRHVEEPQDARDELDRGLELLGDHLVGAEAARSVSTSLT